MRMAAFRALRYGGVGLPHALCASEHPTVSSITMMLPLLAQTMPRMTLVFIGYSFTALLEWRGRSVTILQNFMLMFV